MLVYQNNVLDTMFNSQVVGGGNTRNSCPADNNFGSRIGHRFAPLHGGEDGRDIPYGKIIVLRGLGVKAISQSIPQHPEVHNGLLCLK
jgi:hypothetical protein